MADPKALTPADRRFLRRAIQLGRRGWGRVHPNPMVGCVLVREGEVVGEGWHEEYGSAHAEVNALRQAGEGARGATAYVSLEPCNHHGLTPPCTKALHAAGVRRVVFGASDPGRRSSGGADALRRLGMEVVGPTLSRKRARRENPAFFFNQEEHGIYLALKLAQSLDGRIAEAPGRRTRITGPEAEKEVHRLRSGFDAIMIGSGTAITDDPTLTVRYGHEPRKPPTRIVLDTEARLPPGAALLRDVERVPLWVFTAADAPDDRRERLEAAGARLVHVPRGRGGLSLDAVLAVCWEEGIRSIFCEGGGRVASALLRARRVQRLYLFVAPFVLGERGVPAFPDLAGRRVWEGWTPTGRSRIFGRDVLLAYDGGG